MTALDIMNQARERLGDEKKQRWSDNRLLSIVSQGQVDICIESGYIRKEISLPASIDITRYILPSDCIAIKRVEHGGKLLPLHIRSDQDQGRTTINSDYIAYKSNLQTNRIEVQPAFTELSLTIVYAKGETLEDVLVVSPAYGVITDSTDPNMIVDPLYGVVTAYDIESSTDLNPSEGYGAVVGSNADQASAEFPTGIFGVVTSAEYLTVDTKFGGITKVKGHTVSGTYGIVTDVVSSEDTFHIFYVAAPSKLRFPEAILVMPELWEDILIRYTVGTALQDDNDANNITRGEAELQKYAVKLEKIKALSSTDFSSQASDKNETNFRRI